MGGVPRPRQTCSPARKPFLRHLHCAPAEPVSTSEFPMVTPYYPHHPSAHGLSTSKTILSSGSPPLLSKQSTNLPDAQRTSTFCANSALEPSNTSWGTNLGRSSSLAALPIHHLGSESPTELSGYGHVTSQNRCIPRPMADHQVPH